MSEAVNVLTTSGTPQLALNIGGSTKQASYASGTGTSSLTFTYTIAAGDSDSNGISIDANALSLGSGTISDLAGNAIAMTSGAIVSSAVDDNASFKVDTTAPTVSTTTAIALSATDNTPTSSASPKVYGADDVVTATVTMSEAVNVLTTSGTPQLALNIGGSTKQASYASGTGTSSLTFTYTIASNDTDTNGISIAANALSLNGGTISDLAAMRLL